MQTHFSTSDCAELLGVDSWRIGRLFELALIDEPPRIGRNRAIPSSQLPEIIDALRKRNWLPPTEYECPPETSTR